MHAVKNFALLALATFALAQESQNTDGQVAGSSATLVSQTSDGQVQASSAPLVSQTSDGQVQASSAPLVSQTSDGQVQASSAVAPISQISDGQPQVPTVTPTPISQISDGQPQAPTNGTFTQPAPTGSSAPIQTAGAAFFSWSMEVAGAAGLAAAVALL